MAYEFNITAEHRWFIGTDIIFEFEILSDDGKPVDDITKGVEDVAAWSMGWFLNKKETDSTHVLEKRTGGTGSTAIINVVGVYNVNRQTNTQRVQVVISDDNTDTLTPTSKMPGPYKHALKRFAAGGDAILVFGSATLLKSSADPA